MDLKTSDKSFLVAFASQYCFFIKAQNFHWNVTGPNFPQYHGLFGDIYSEVYGSIDEFAENIRQTDSFVPAGFNELSMISKISDESKTINAKAMLQELLDDCSTMISLFEVIYKKAEEANMFGFANFLADRHASFKKHRWMLKSTLKA